MRHRNRSGDKGSSPIGIIPDMNQIQAESDRDSQAKADSEKIEG
jgi:hypothetical protein